MHSRRDSAIGRLVSARGTLSMNSLVELFFLHTSYSVNLAMAFSRAANSTDHITLNSIDVNM